MNEERGERTPTQTVHSFPRTGAEKAWRDHGPNGEGPAGERLHIAPPVPPDPRLHPDCERPATEQLSGAARHRRPHETTRAPSAKRSEYDAGRSATASRTGLELSSKMTFDKWLSIGRDLAITTNSVAWWLGDWLIYGEKAFTGRYRSAIEQTSLDYKTLRNYAWVARRFAPERRHEALSFGHHAELAALSEPEQDFWLRKAESLGWSRNELRLGVRTSLREREEPGAAPDDGEAPDDQAEADPAQQAVLTVGGEGEELNVKLTHQQLEVIRQAASSARVALDIWVTRILEQAARSVVNSIGHENAA